MEVVLWNGAQPPRLEGRAEIDIVKEVRMQIINKLVAKEVDWEHEQNKWDVVCFNWAKFRFRSKKTY